MIIVPNKIVPILELTLCHCLIPIVLEFLVNRRFVKAKVSGSLEVVFIKRNSELTLQ